MQTYQISQEGEQLNYYSWRQNIATSLESAQWTPFC